MIYVKDDILQNLSDERSKNCNFVRFDQACSELNVNCGYNEDDIDSSFWHALESSDDEDQRDFEGKEEKKNHTFNRFYVKGSLLLAAGSKCWCHYKPKLKGFQMTFYAINDERMRGIR